MFCGPSGTGKTLMVNALAAHLEKRVLLVAWSHARGLHDSLEWTLVTQLMLWITVPSFQQRLRPPHVWFETLRPKPLLAVHGDPATQ